MKKLFRTMIGMQELMIEICGKRIIVLQVLGFIAWLVTTITLWKYQWMKITAVVSTIWTIVIYVGTAMKWSKEI